MLKKAKQAYQEENFEGALEYAMNVSPMNVQSYICAAKSASQLNQHDMALKLFHEGAQLEPELPLIWKGMLEVAEDICNQEAQINALEHLLGIFEKKNKQDKYESSVLSLAQLYMATGCKEQAILKWIELAEIQNPVISLPSYLEIWVTIYKLQDGNDLKTMEAIYNYARKESWNLRSSAHYDIVNEIVDKRIQQELSSPLNDEEKMRFCEEILQWFPFSKAALKFVAKVTLSDGVVLNSKWFQHLRAIDPDSGLINIYDGMELASHSKFEQAHLALTQGLKHHEDLVAPWIQLAEVVLENSAVYDAKFAIVCLQKAKTNANGPIRVNTDIITARALYETGETERALEIMRKYFDQYPTACASVYLETLIKAGKLERATAVTEILADQDLISGELLLSRGWLNYHLGNMDDAQENIEQFRKRYPQNPLGSLRLGVVFLWHGRMMESYDLLMKAAQQNPWEEGVFRYLGEWFQAEQDDTRAKQCFLKALSMWPDDDDAAQALEKIYLKVGEDFKARQLWETCVARSPSRKWAWLRLAQDQLDKGEVGYIQSLHKALRCDPQDGHVWASLGYVYALDGKYCAAHKSLLKAVVLGNDNTALQIELARIEKELGMYDDVIQRLETIISTTSDQPNVAWLVYAETLYIMACEFHKNGCCSRASQYLTRGFQPLEKYREANPNCTTSAKLLGDVCSLLLRFDQNSSRMLERGRSAYSAAIELNPGIASFYRDLGWLEIHATRGSISSTPTTIPTSLLKTSMLLNPMDPMTWNVLAALFSSPSQQHFCFVRAAELGQNSTTWENLLSLYIRTKRFTLARECVTVLQSIDASSPLVWFGHGILKKYAMNSDPKDYISDFRCAIDFGFQPDCLLAFADAAVRSSTDCDIASFAIKKYLEVRASNPRAWNIAGSLAQLRGMHDSARQAFECAVEIIETMENGTDRSRLRQIVLANLATSHIGRSNFTRGINVLETLIQPSLIDKVAIVQGLAGRNEYAEAFRVLSCLHTNDQSVKASILRLRVKLAYMCDMKMCLTAIEELRVESSSHEDMTTQFTCAALCIHNTDSYIATISELQQKLRNRNGILSCQSLELNAMSQEHANIGSRGFKFLQDCLHMYPVDVKRRSILLTQIRRKIHVSDLALACALGERNDPIVNWIAETLRAPTNGSPLLKKQVIADPTNAMYWILLACTLTIQMFSRAEKCTRVISAVKCAGACKGAPLNLIEKIVNTAQLDTAQKRLVAVKEESAKNPNIRTLSELASVYEASGMITSAIRVWTYILKLALILKSPDSVEFVLLRIVLTHYRSQNTTGARRILKYMSMNLKSNQNATTRIYESLNRN